MQTGEEYAQKGTLDVPTFVGMRVAMIRAVKQWHQPGTPHTAAQASILIHEMCMNNEYLRIAGTEQIVERYYQQIAAGNPAGMMAFFDHISFGDVERMERALETNNGIALVRAAGAFSAAA